MARGYSSVMLVRFTPGVHSGPTEEESHVQSGSCRQMVRIAATVVGIGLAGGASMSDGAQARAVPTHAARATGQESPATTFEGLFTEAFGDIPPSPELAVWRAEMGDALGWFNHPENSPDDEQGSEDLVYLFIGLPDQPGLAVTVQFHGPIDEERGRPFSNVDDMIADPAWGFAPESERPVNQGQLDFLAEQLLRYWNDNQPASNDLWVDRDVRPAATVPSATAAVPVTNDVAETPVTSAPNSEEALLQADCALLENVIWEGDAFVGIDLPADGQPFTDAVRQAIELTRDSFSGESARVRSQLAVTAFAQYSAAWNFWLLSGIYTNSDLNAAGSASRAALAPLQYACGSAP